MRRALRFFSITLILTVASYLLYQEHAFIQMHLYEMTAISVLYGLSHLILNKHSVAVIALGLVTATLLFLLAYGVAIPGTLATRPKVVLAVMLAVLVPLTVLGSWRI